MSYTYIPGTATAADVLAGKKFSAKNLYNKTGTIVNNGAGGTVTPSASTQTKPAGYYSSAITISGVSVPAANVLSGTTIAGTAGTMPNNGAGGTVTPSTSTQTKPAGYYSSAITISAVNAPAAKILSDTTIAGVTGTVPIITSTADPAQGAALWPDGGLAVYPSPGYRKGGAGAGEIKVSTAQLQAAEGDLVASNIRFGINMFGVGGNLRPQKAATGNYVWPTNKAGEAYKAGYSAPSLTVTGLNFFPKMILIYSTTDSVNTATVYYWSQMGYDNGGWSTNAVMFSTGINGYFSSAFMAATPEISNGGQPPYVNGTGFKLPVYVAEALYNWTAVGWD